MTQEQNKYRIEMIKKAMANPLVREKIRKSKRLRIEELGYINSPEARKKMSKSHKGKPLSEENKKNISKAMKGKIPKNIDTIKGWNKGMSRSQETKLKLSKALKGRFIGKNHPYWKGGKRCYYGRIARALFYEYNSNVICSDCGTSENIHIHHKDENWKNNNLDNLQALCRCCHQKLHNKMRIFQEKS